MVNLTTAEQALKTVYLGAITDILNTKTNPLLSAIKQSSEGVYGKEIKRAVRVGLNGGIGAGTEDGNLPTASGNKYVQFTTTLKNLYGQLEITDKAIRASSSNEGAFVDLLNAETDGLIESAKFNFGRMLFGNGSGVISLANFAADAKSAAVVENVSKFLPGMIVDAYKGDNFVATLTVSEVNFNLGVIHFENAVSALNNETANLYMQGSKDREITGLGHLFDLSSDTLYGVARQGLSMLNPYVENNVGDITDLKIQKALDMIELQSGSQPNFIVCSAGVRRAFLDYQAGFKRNIDTMEIAGGFKVVTYNGIPLVVDRFVEKGTMYLLNTDDFKLHQLCDWSWLENENGKILRQSQGKPTYTATLVKYADLICERPNAQGKLTGINEE